MVILLGTFSVENSYVFQITERRRKNMKEENEENEESVAWQSVLKMKLMEIYDYLIGF